MEKLPQNYDGVEVGIHGKIAVVTLRRAQNKFNFEMVAALHKALDEVERHPDVAVLVTTGEGGFFSNGLELEYVIPAGHVLARHIRPDFSEVFHKLQARILTFPMPTIAAVNGHAFAGGAFLAMAHDYTVMQSGRGRWCLYEVHVPIEFPPFFLALLKAKLTPAQRTDAAVFGRRYSAEEAKARGLITHVAPPGKHLEVAKDLASQITSSPAPYKRESVLNMKSDMYKSVLSERLNFHPAKL